MKTIGIVGGIGPESTIDYYRSIITQFQARRKTNHYPHIIINSVDLTHMVALLENGKLDELVESLRVAIERLATAGADLAVFASNTPHLLFDRVQAVSPIPLLSIVEETCKKAKSMGYTKLGLFGTRFTMQSGFYQRVFENGGIAIVVPESDKQEYIHNKYMNELVLGHVVEETKREFLQIATDMKEQEAVQGIILGGTELPLLLKDDEGLGIPLLNTSQIHVESIIDRLG